MNILITGGAGFIGSHLSDRLLSEGHNVIVIDNLITGSRKNIEHNIGKERFKFLNRDIVEDILTYDFDWFKLDRIYHLASIASPINYNKYSLETLKVGSIGTMNILDLAVKHKARFLLTSTSEVYGDPEIHPQNENYWGHVNPIGPRSCYDESKRFSESITMNYNIKENLETRIVRIFNTYGPRMQLNDGRVVPEFIYQVLNNKDITIYGDGNQTRSFCYVSDLVEGLIKAMESNYIYPINLGNPSEITINEFADKIMKVSDIIVKKINLPLPKDDPKRRKPDITRAREILGWKPIINLEQGLIKTIEYFKNLKG